jgi:hypothetical protein
MSLTMWSCARPGRPTFTFCNHTECDPTKGTLSVSTASEPSPCQMGPELAYSYISSDGIRTHYRVDLEALADPRERAVCSALLMHALALINAENDTPTIRLVRRDGT